MYKSDLDYNIIDSLDEEQLQKYILEHFSVPAAMSEEPAVGKYRYFAKLSLRYKYMKYITRVLHLDLSNEQFVFALATVPRLLAEACAGAGKTTTAVARTLDGQIFLGLPANHILMLAFNQNAARQFKEKYKYIVSNSNKTLIFQKPTNPNICAYTFHAWCRQWVYEYSRDFKLPHPEFAKDFAILDDGDAVRLMRMAINSVIKLLKLNIYLSNAIINAFVNLYNYRCETMSWESPEVWTECSAMTDLSKFSVDSIYMVFKKFELAKMLKQKGDQSDMLKYMLKICENPEYVNRIRENYQFVTVDEYQDFTPIMRRILELIFTGDESLGIPYFDNGFLTAIGDGDQSIYRFRGADASNCIHFRESFAAPDGTDNVRITTMSINRRCKEEIVASARKIILKNAERIDKPIKALTNGGAVEMLSYGTQDQEHKLLIDKLRLLPDRELDQTFISYRNNASSMLLGLHLMDSGIKFRFSGETTLLGDPLGKAILSVMNMLGSPSILQYMNSSLYKVLPKSATLKRETITKMLTEESERRNHGNDSRNFWELDWSAWKGINNFDNAMEELRLIHKLIRMNTPMNKYIRKVVNMIRVYYFDWQNENERILSEVYIEQLTSWFEKPITFVDFERQYRETEKNLQKNAATKTGAMLTTMHKLKGLECNTIFVIDLNDDLFPGTDFGASGKLDAAQYKVIEEETNRLMYVAITRARDKVYLLYDKNMPSRFIRILEDTPALADAYSAYLKRAAEKNEEQSKTPHAGDKTDAEVLKRVNTQDVSKQFLYADEMNAAADLEPDVKQANQDAKAPQEAQAATPEADTGDMSDILDDFLGDDDITQEQGVDAENANAETQLFSVNSDSKSDEIAKQENALTQEAIRAEVGDKNFKTLENKPHLQSALAMMLGKGDTK